MSEFEDEIFREPVGIEIAEAHIDPYIYEELFKLEEIVPDLATTSNPDDLKMIIIGLMRNCFMRAVSSCDNDPGFVENWKKDLRESLEL